MSSLRHLLFARPSGERYQSHDEVFASSSGKSYNNNFRGILKATNKASKVFVTVSDPKKVIDPKKILLLMHGLFVTIVYKENLILCNFVPSKVQRRKFCCINIGKGFLWV